MEMTIEYWNALAQQTILVSSLLCGFSVTVVANLLVSSKNDQLTNTTLKVATLAAGCFLVAVFSMIQIAMLTTPGGYEEAVAATDFVVPRAIGMFTFMIGLFAITAMIALAGWSKSKKVGRFTTTIGIVTLLLALVTMVRVSF